MDIRISSNKFGFKDNVFVVPFVQRCAKNLDVTSPHSSLNDMFLKNEYNEAHNP